MDSFLDKLRQPCDLLDFSKLTPRRALFMESLLSAILIALLMLIPAHYGVFGQVDHLIFSKISTIHAALNKDKNYDAAVLEIDQVFFDEFFDGSSPLPRDKLGDLLGKLIDRSTISAEPGNVPSTRTLTIDLDISPNGDTLDQFDEQIGSKEDVTCEPLPAKNFKVERALCSTRAQGIRVVLLAPFVTDDPTVRKKYRWMRFVCKNTDADFAFGDIPRATDLYTTHYYSREKHEPQPKVLASVTRQYAAGTGPVPYGLCAEIKQQNSSAELPVRFGFLDRSIAENGHAMARTLQGELKSDDHNMRLLDFRHPALSIPLSTMFCHERDCSVDNVKTLAEKITTTRTHASLFLGGTWHSESDVFNTPTGRKAGVHLHALAELNQPISKMHHWIVFLIEIPVGMGMIYIFRARWKSADAQLKKTDAALSASDYVQMRRAIGRYLLALAIIVATGLLLAVGVLAFAAVLLSTYMWITPSALLLSILLKTYMERNSGHEHHTFSPYRNCRTRALSHLPLMSLVAWALYFLITDIFA